MLEEVLHVHIVAACEFPHALDVASEAVGRFGDVLVDVAHDCREGGAARLCRESQRGHGTCEAENVGLAHAYLGTCRREALSHGRDIGLGGGEIITEGDHSRAVVLGLRVRHFRNVGELCQLGRRCLGVHVRGYVEAADGLREHVQLVDGITELCAEGLNVEDLRGADGVGLREVDGRLLELLVFLLGAVDGFLDRGEAVVDFDGRRCARRSCREDGQGDVRGGRRAELLHLVTDVVDGSTEFGGLSTNTNEGAARGFQLGGRLDLQLLEVLAGFF